MFNRFNPPTLKQVKDAIRQKYAWPGGYEIFLITSDGGVLCCPCARKEYRQIVWDRINKQSTGWNVAGIDATCNVDEPGTCSHCSASIGEAE